MSLSDWDSRRIRKFTTDFRDKQGQLPTLKDFEAGKFPRELVESAVKAGVIELFYVTLTNGTVVKGFKLREWN